MNRIVLPELEGVTDFLDARRPSSSARSIEDWCEARDVNTRDVLFYARALTRSCLATISEQERRTGEPVGAGPVESAITAAIVTALQVGVDVERRRRDKRELPC